MGADDLYDAVKHGNVDKVISLFERPGKVKIDKLNDDHETLLTMAVRVQSSEIVQILLDKGADVNMKNDSGKAPLHLACFEGNLLITEILLRAGAQIDIEDDKNRLPLYWAVKQNQPQITKILIAADKSGMEKQSAGGDTVLHEAIMNSEKDVVLALLEGGAPVNILNEEGEAPIHVAARQGRDVIVEALADKGAAVCGLNSSGESILHISSRVGNIKIITYLLETVKVDQDFINKQTVGGKSLIKGKTRDTIGWTALHMSCAQDRFEITKQLLDHNANTKLKSKDGLTPQRLAELFKHKKILTLFGIEEEEEKKPVSSNRRLSLPVVSTAPKTPQIRRASVVPPKKGGKLTNDWKIK